MEFKSFKELNLQQQKQALENNYKLCDSYAYGRIEDEYSDILYFLEDGDYKYNLECSLKNTFKIKELSTGVFNDIHRLAMCGYFTDKEILYIEKVNDMFDEIIATDHNSPEYEKLEYELEIDKTVLSDMVLQLFDNVQDYYENIDNIVNEINGTCYLEKYAFDENLKAYKLNENYNVKWLEV